MPNGRVVTSGFRMVSINLAARAESHTFAARFGEVGIEHVATLGYRVARRDREAV
jgi:hypothetical protein